MNPQEPLVIMVTRYFTGGGLPNEWRETWRFDDRYVIAFIRNGVASLHQPNNLASVNLEEHIDDDVWVIHGDLLRRTLEEDPLWNSLANLIDAVQTKRRLNILIHPGGQTLGDVLRSLLPRLPQSLQELFRNASSYSHQDPQFLQFAGAVTQRQYNPHQQSANSQSVNRSGYQRALEELRKFAAGETARTLATRLSILKHRIAHLFLPIDIDLQGLIETDFREDYWQEVVEAWKDRRALDALNDAQRLIYGEDPKRDTVEKVLREAGKQDRIGSVEKLLPRPNSTSESEKFSKVNQILKFLGEGNKEELRELFKGGNPFHCWLKELESALDNLRKEVEQGG